VGNYVIANPSNLGNFMIADSKSATYWPSGVIGVFRLRPAWLCQRELDLDLAHIS